MAVSIDRVYQKVLALANKEQRGYITPQEFNLFADHAQMEIFEQYFYDLNQHKRVPGNNHEYSDIVSIIKDKISLFEVWHRGNYNVTVANEYGDCIAFNTDIPDLYRLGEIAVTYKVNGKVYTNICEQLTPKEATLYQKSKLTRESYNRPYFVKHSNVQGGQRLKIYPHPLTVGFPGLSDGTQIPQSTQFAGISADYIRKPKNPNWAYVVVNNKPLYNSTSSMDFELHASEEAELVYRILTLAGIAIEKPQLTQMAAGFEQAKVQQEKK